MFLETEKNSIPLYTLKENSMTEFPFYIGKNSFHKNTHLHQHQFVQINYITKGSGVHFIANQEYAIQTGDIFVVPPFVPHKIFSSSDKSNIELIEVEFVPEFLNEQFSDIHHAKSLFDFKYISLFLVNDSTASTGIELNAKAQSAIGNITQSMMNEYINRTPLFEHSFKALLLELLVILIRSCEQPAKREENMYIYLKHRAAIENVIEFIDSHFNEEIKLEDIARKAMMSNTYFCYFFKLLSGKTFTQYLIDKRLERAKEYLVHSDLNITEVALHSGFNSVSYFIRVFKNSISISPAQYRKLAHQQESALAEEDAFPL